MSQVYVSTYRKYNNGSLQGEWLDLTDYDSEKEFYEACTELHSDEEDPELMFQDWENIPAAFTGESTIDERVWDWLKLSVGERQTVATYLDEIDSHASLDEALVSTGVEKRCFLGSTAQFEDTSTFALYPVVSEFGLDIFRSGPCQGRRQAPPVVHVHMHYPAHVDPCFEGTAITLEFDLTAQGTLAAGL